MAIDVRNGYRLYHWKHGWIPLTHYAAMKKAKGDPKLAQKYLDKYNIRGDVHKSFANTGTSPAGVGGSGAHFRGADGFQSVAREHLNRGRNVVAAFNKNTGNFHLLDVDKGRAVVLHADVAEAIQRGQGNILGVKDAGSAGKLLKVDFGSDGIAHVEVHDDPNVKPVAINPIKAAPIPVTAAPPKKDGPGDELARVIREAKVKDDIPSNIYRQINDARDAGHIGDQTRMDLAKEAVQKIEGFVKADEKAKRVDWYRRNIAGATSEGQLKPLEQGIRLHHADGRLDVDDRRELLDAVFAKRKELEKDGRVSDVIRHFDRAQNVDELRGVKAEVKRAHAQKPFNAQDVSLLNNAYKVRKGQLEQGVVNADVLLRELRGVQNPEQAVNFRHGLRVHRDRGAINQQEFNDLEALAKREENRLIDAEVQQREAAAAAAAPIPEPRDFRRMMFRDRNAVLDRIEAEQGKDARDAFEAKVAEHNRRRQAVWSGIDKYRGGKDRGPVLKHNIRTLERQGILDADEARRWNRIVDQKIERAAMLKERRDRRNARMGGGARGNRGVGGTSNAAADTSPEAKQAQIDHFAAGGTVMDAPQNGLWNHIASNPDRFEVKAQVDKKGVSDVYKIHDKQTGERLFAKRSAFRQDVEKEVAAAAIANQLGLTSHKARFGQSRDGHGSGVVLMQDAAQANGHEALERVVDLRHGTDIAGKVRAGNRPGGFVDMALFDYLIDNTGDRHAGNAFLLQNKDGSLDVGFLDHGLAFGGQDRPDFAAWFNGAYRARGWDIQSYIAKAAGNDRAEVARQARDTLDRLRNLDIDATIASASSKHNGIPAEYADLMKKRLAVLLDPANETAVIAALAQAA